MDYAKRISERKIDINPPRTAVIDGMVVCGRLPEPYLNSLGYYALDDTAVPGTPDDGCHLEARYNYDDDEHPTKVVLSWVSVEDPPAPPRSLSKRNLMNALKSRNLWTAVKGYMQSTDDLWEQWEASTTLDEDEDLVKDAVTALKASLGLTDEQVEAIMAESEAEQ